MFHLSYAPCNFKVITKRGMQAHKLPYDRFVSILGRVVSLFANHVTRHVRILVKVGEICVDLDGAFAMFQDLREVVGNCLNSNCK